MSRICDLTGKAALTGNNVSHSNVKTKRKFYPNLQTKRFYIPEEDRWITLKVSTSAIKTINKKGITAVIDKFIKKGSIQSLPPVIKIFMKSVRQLADKIK